MAQMKLLRRVRSLCGIVVQHNVGSMEVQVQRVADRVLVLLGEAVKVHASELTGPPAPRPTAEVARADWALAEVGGQIEGGERVGEVWAASMVGVLGIGGVGKTTAAALVAAEAGKMGFGGVV